MLRIYVSKKQLNRISGSLLLITMVFSMVFLLPKVSGAMPQGNNVSWDSQNQTTQSTWNWTNQGWAFGPYPTFSVILSNGTEITDDNYVPLNTVFTVRIDVQKSIFVGNATLGQAGVNWNMQLMSQNGSNTGNANCQMMYTNSIQQQGWNETNTWNIQSSVNNQTGGATQGPGGSGFMPMQNGFFVFNPALSNITETDVGWRLQIVGAFNSSTPMGPFWVNLQITDQYNNWMDVNSQGQQNSQSNNRQVAVGRAGFVYGGYQDYYTFQKLDMQNNPLMSVSKGAKWKMQLNVTSSDFANASIGLNLPWNIQQYVNVTGWYQQVTTEQGGWMYNETSGSYYWNSTVAVTRNQQVYGPHLEQRWVSLPNNNHVVNVTDNQLDPTTNTNTITQRTMNVQDQLFLMYDQGTHTFDIKKGYSYNSYDTNLKQYVNYQVLSPIDPTDPSSQFFTLSIPDCNAYQVAPNKYVVEFVGSFSNTTNYTQDQYNLQVNVFSTKNQIWANWADTDPSDTQVVVDRPVAVSTILDSKGQPSTTQSIFMIGQNKPFTVQSKIYGSTQLYNNLDAIGVSFNSNFGTWTDTENSNSQVEIRLVKNLDTGQITSQSYNRTNVNRYVYGSHLGWAYVNVTDWHTEYNSTTSTWDWVDSPHLIWNQTTLTDWHWEYYRLNQTELARDPNSPNIWMDTTTCWVDDMDPAFLMPTSYATMNAADLAVENGVVVVNLNVTFAPNAPQGNYMYNMIFQNLTYGQDNSQGWGEHQITEWTNDPTYYINGTNGQVLVSTPSNPLYTIYQAQKYQVEQVPYISIAGNTLPIKPQTQYDQSQQKEWSQYLLSGPYDPSIDRQTQYYQLQNGTNIYVDQAYQTVIRTLQLTTASAYTLDSGSPVSLPNGTTLNTYMNRAVADYSRQYWDQSLGNVLPYYYEELNGSRVYLNTLFEQSLYNTTTSHWDRSSQVYTENDSTLLVDSLGWGVKLGSTVVLLRDPGNWQTLPDGSGYYLVMQNGTRITIANPWVSDDQRIVTVNGVSYQIGWPSQYYQATYQGQTLQIPTNGQNNDVYVQSFFYTDLGVDGGTKYELPYPGAMATSWWDLQGIESTGQKLKTLKSITIGGSDYLLNFDSDTQTYYVDVDGVRSTVTYPTVDYGTFYATIDGQDCWNITQNGWTLKYGNYSQLSNQMDAAGTLTTTTGYDSTQMSWSNYNRYGYDYENATLYLLMPNGTRLDVSSDMNLIIWKVQVGDQTYYTTDNNAQTEMTTDPATNQPVYNNYFRTLDNQKIYFNWTTPASWMQETHIPIAGTNYTKLIPYTWQNQTIFDKVVVYNITIPEQGTSGHTYVYYEDGTEVPIGTSFKVIGTTYGPGTNTNFNQNGNSYTFNGASMPQTTAPWNPPLNVAYMITLSGDRIYSPSMFGWNYGISDWGSNKQWQFNGDPSTANVTVSVVQGGYTIYLNDTIKADITTQYICGGATTDYVVLLNGTRLDAQWMPSNQEYFTMVGNQRYYFRSPVTYSNLTDDGVTYSLADPLQYDQRHFYTPTTYLAPTVSSNTYSLMNTTSDSVQKDGTGYYLISADNQSRLDLGLVDNWWAPLPTALRNQVFNNQQNNQLSDYYPRYNVTINGQEYFVIDPSPVTDRWNGDWSTQNAMYRYPATVSFTLDGTPYTINILNNGFWNNNLTIRQLNTINLDGTQYTLDDQNNWKASYQVPINSQNTQIYLDNMNIYETHQAWGNIYMWKLTDLGITTTSQINSLIVGTPQWGMWGIKAFKTVDSTGAIDLDGDLSTTSDQYFVRRVHDGLESQTQTVQRMTVNTDWNPDATKVGGDIKLNAWMGQLQVSWTSQWSESYIWYHASDMSPVSSQEMAQIQNTIINNATHQANPGYWDISYMVRNQTWQDILDQAAANNWDWINSNTNTWNWLWFGTDQNYNVNVMSGNTPSTVGVDLRYEFAGINLVNGSQQTNYFMPKSVGQVSFVTPGQAYGDANPTGSMLLPLGSNITFGVTYDDVNGTLFPYSSQRSMWNWWDSPIYGSDFNSPNMMDKPTNASIDQLQFAVHFAGVENSTSQYNSASMKIDQRVGDWNLPADTVDGRETNSSGTMVPLMGNQVLENRSLALNYYVTASTSLGWSVKNDEGTDVSNNQVTNSSEFDLAAQLANVNFASVKLGSIYDWGKPTTDTDQIRTFNVTSQTTSIQNFQSSYQSGSGKSSTGFDISSSMYFLTQGFPQWDGYSIYNDPEVSVLVSKGTTASSPSPSPTPPQPTPSPSPAPTQNNNNNNQQNSNNNQPSNTNNQQTTQPTPKPSGNSNPTSTPKPTTTATPGNVTPQPSNPPMPVSTTLILVAVGVGVAIAIGSLVAVRTRKKH